MACNQWSRSRARNGNGWACGWCTMETDGKTSRPVYAWDNRPPAHPCALLTLPRPTRLRWTGIHRPIRVHCGPFLGPSICVAHHASAHPCAMDRDPPAHPSTWDAQPPAHPSVLPTMPRPTCLPRKRIYRPIQLPWTPNHRPIHVHC